jgi:hypothetical protein
VTRNLEPVEEEDSPVLDTVARNMRAATIAITLKAARRNLVMKDEEELVHSKSSEKTKQ